MEQFRDNLIEFCGTKNLSLFVNGTLHYRLHFRDGNHMFSFHATKVFYSIEGGMLTFETRSTGGCLIT